MPNKNYSVVRLDDIKSRHVGRNYSVRVPDTFTAENPLQNGNVVTIDKREVGNLDVHTVKEPVAGDSVVLIAEVALVYDNKRDTTEKDFFMVGGEVVRGYELSKHDLISISKQGFVDPTATFAEGETVVPSGYKLDKGAAGATGTVFTVVKEEKVGGWLAVGATQAGTDYVILEVTQV